MMILQVVEHASICLTRIAESFALSSEKLDTLCSHGLISQAVRLISVSASSGGSVSQTSLSNSTYTVYATTHTLNLNRFNLYIEM